ncbi:MAG: NUDIX domain-containing protein [Patescibacteria group bacterium]
MSKEPTFVPKPGQVDFTNIRWAPVVNSVLEHEGAFLVVQRSPSMRLYPGYWNGISGFLDDDKSLEEKVQTEIQEELGMHPEDIIDIRLGTIFDQEEPKYHKTWIVHPVHVRVKTKKVTLDFEATNYQWLPLQEILHVDLLPGFDVVLTTLFPTVASRNI